jgi:dihydrofolate reductase
MISLIAAIAKNNVIGVDGRLPWHLPADFAWFKRITTGKPIIMGRKTHESIGRPLPNRLNIVISRTAQTNSDNIVWVKSLKESISFAQQQHAKDEIMIIGGGQIYAEALPLATRLYLTEIDLDIAGDAFFPTFNTHEWQKTVLETHAATDTQPAFIIAQYDRVR